MAYGDVAHMIGREVLYFLNMASRTRPLWWFGGWCGGGWWVVGDIDKRVEIRQSGTLPLHLACRDREIRVTTDPMGTSTPRTAENHYRQNIERAALGATQRTDDPFPCRLKILPQGQKRPEIDRTEVESIRHENPLHNHARFSIGHAIIHNLSSRCNPCALQDLLSHPLSDTTPPVTISPRGAPLRPRIPPISPSANTSPHPPHTERNRPSRATTTPLPTALCPSNNRHPEFSPHIPLQLG